MSGMTAIAKRYKIGGVILTTEVARHQVMNVRLTAITSDATGNALIIVAVQDDGANMLPTKLSCFWGVRNDQRISADWASNRKTGTFRIHHQMFAAVWAVKGDVNHERGLAAARMSRRGKTVKPPLSEFR